MRKTDLDSLKRMVLSLPSWQADVVFSRRDVLDWIDNHKEDRKEIERLREQISQLELGESK